MGTRPSFARSARALERIGKRQGALGVAWVLVLSTCAAPRREPEAAPATAPPAPVAPLAPAVPPAAPAPTAPARLWTLHHQAIDEAVARALEPVLAGAVLEVEHFFGSPFTQPFAIVIHPDRAAFDASFPPEWGIEKTECWMVASGVATGLALLSPRAWKAEACEHDADDAEHVRRLLTHELVHVYHGQHSPSPDYVDVTGIDWFVEGLATFASGQLEGDTLASAREAIEAGRDPKKLSDAWKGKYRYGVSGSLVAFLDHELGRARLTELLGATSPDEVFEQIGMDEAALLARWRAFVLAP